VYRHVLPRPGRRKLEIRVRRLAGRDVLGDGAAPGDPEDDEQLGDPLQPN
jgi:hypothetical protein